MEPRASIAYQPALDGVRALAVAVVLLFHAEVPGFSGGYLGVSVFFTLSGYLITSLLLAEHAATGSISFGRFYARRVRRLLPASIVCLLAIVIVSAVTEIFAGVDELRRQIVGCLLQVSNWVFLAGEGSYQQIFSQAAGARSPVEHFWSLSIEEQFYWLWPPTMALVLGRLRSHRARTMALAAMTLVFGLAAPFTAAVWGADAAYWATPARVSEILVGALLAVALAGREVRARVAWLAPFALLALAVCVATFPAAGGPAYEGWLPVVALGSGALVLGLQAESPLKRLLATSPFVWLGGISYGVYLYHWPIYVIADEGRTGLEGWQLVVLQLALTLVLAQVSYVLLEQPIRRYRGSNRRPTFALGALATAGVAVAAVAVVPAALGEYWETDEATVAAAAIDVTGSLAPLQLTTQPPAVQSTVPATTVPVPSTTAQQTIADDGPTSTTTSTTTTTTEAPLPALSRPVRIVVAGDSTANATAAGLVEWAAKNPDMAQVEVVGAPGCGFVTGGERRVGGFQPYPPPCDDWLSRVLPNSVSQLKPDVVMLMVTTWDVVDHKWDGSEELSPLDAEFARRIDTDYRAITEQLLGSGAGSIAWIAPPVPNAWWTDDTTGQQDPARHAVVRGVMDEIASQLPDQVGVIDLAAWLEQNGLTDDHEVRPDGVHLDTVAAEDIADRFLGERLIRIALT
jgi:peptidoglycan/LPS O-acetylase OafA/YrhL